MPSRNNRNNSITLRKKNMNQKYSFTTGILMPLIPFVDLKSARSLSRSSKGYGFVVKEYYPHYVEKEKIIKKCYSAYFRQKVITKKKEMMNPKFCRRNCKSILQRITDAAIRTDFIDLLQWTTDLFLQKAHQGPIAEEYRLNLNTCLNSLNSKNSNISDIDKICSLLLDVQQQYYKIPNHFVGCDCSVCCYSDKEKNHLSIPYTDTIIDNNQNKFNKTYQNIIDLTK